MGVYCLEMATRMVCFLHSRELEFLTRLTCCSDTYLVNVDLTKAFDLSDGSAYKLSVIPTNVPNLKDQALWYVQMVKYQ